MKFTYDEYRRNRTILLLIPVLDSLSGITSSNFIYLLDLVPQNDKYPTRIYSLVSFIEITPIRPLKNLKG